MLEQFIISFQILIIDVVMAADNVIIISLIAANFATKELISFLEGFVTAIAADWTLLFYLFEPWRFRSILRFPSLFNIFN